MTGAGPARKHPLPAGLHWCEVGFLEQKLGVPIRPHSSRTPEAAADLRSFRRYDQEQIVGGIEAQLPHQAAEPSRNRKRLRPNRLAEWELRVGDFRVFYDVHLDESLVKIEAIGYKERSKLFVHGEEYEL